MHFLYPPLTIGLALLLFIAELQWWRTDDDSWYRLTRFFEKLFIINFGAGVATGVTMEMTFGILYGPFSQAAGPYFGNILGYETITAFMYEAGFIGLMIFGWGKISQRMHLFATFNVMLSSTLSAFWIMNANSWMQTPAGVVLKNGMFHVVDWYKAIFNPAFLSSFFHMWVATIELALFFVIAVSSWYLLKGRHIELFRRPLIYAILAAVVIAPLQMYLGDDLGHVIAKYQPASLAAMEGHFHTYWPDGQPRTGWHILAWPEQGHNAWALTIPHALSLIENHDWSSPVPGMDQIPLQDRPPVWVPFYAFRVMVAIGGMLFLMALWGARLVYKKALTSSGRETRWFLRAAVVSGFLPFLAVWTGWWVREVGRQPWLAYGMMRVSDGVSHMTVAEAAGWLIGFAFFELIVWVFTWHFMAKVIRIGPDLESPIMKGGNETLGDLNSADVDVDTDPAYTRF